MQRSASAGTRLHEPLAFHGRVELRVVASAVLAENPLGDPHVRELPVYVPPGTHAELPLLLCLTGFTGRPQSALDTHPWHPGFVWRFDRAVAAGESAPAVLALPDCFTRLGGSQYVNSPAVGRYEDHVVQELLPLLLEAYPVSSERCAVMGKSSGGFGALRLAMRHPGRFQACASLSGDCGFDFLFPGEFLACLRGLAPHGGDPARFLAAFRDEPRLDGDAHAVINTLAMAACYSPNPASPLGFDLPFDLATGELVDAVWQRWLAFDPLRSVAEHAEALKALRLLHLECGRNDEFHLQWGLRRLSRELARLNVPHVHEEHDGGHRGLEARYPQVLDALTRALGG